MRSGVRSAAAVGTLLVGLAVTSHSPVVATTAIPSQVSGLPAGQQAADIGAPAIAGATSYSTGAYEIQAGGGDIWGIRRSVPLRLPTGQW